jgi:hypothetical protein
MDNSFISAKTKKDYCAQLHCIVDDIGPSQEFVPNKDIEMQKRLSSSSGLMGTISASMATMAGMMVAVITVVAEPMADISDRITQLPIYNPFILAVGATALASSISLLAIIAVRRAESSKVKYKRLRASRAAEAYLRERPTELASIFKINDISDKT